MFRQQTAGHVQKYGEHTPETGEQDRDFSSIAIAVRSTEQRQSNGRDVQKQSVVHKIIGGLTLYVVLQNWILV